MTRLGDYWGGRGRDEIEKNINDMEFHSVLEDSSYTKEFNRGEME